MQPRSALHRYDKLTRDTRVRDDLTPICLTPSAFLEVLARRRSVPVDETVVVDQVTSNASRPVAPSV